MTEIETVLYAIKTAIENADIADAVLSFPSENKYRYEGPVIAIGISRCVSADGGLFSYLGTRYNALTDVYTELFGKKLEMTVSLDIRCPVSDTHSGISCINVFNDAVKSLNALSDGIKIKEMLCGDTSYDRISDMYRCRAELKIDAFLIGEADSETNEFTDFTLRGEMVG